MVARSPFNVITYTVCAPKINLHYFCTFVWGVFHPLIRTNPLASPLLLLFYVCSVEMTASQDFLPKDLKIPCILTFVEETNSVVITLQNLFEGSRRGTSWSFLKWEYLVVLGVVSYRIFWWYDQALLTRHAILSKNCLYHNHNIHALLSRLLPSFVSLSLYYSCRNGTTIKKRVASSFCVPFSLPSFKSHPFV